MVWKDFFLNQTEEREKNEGKRDWQEKWWKEQKKKEDERKPN